MVFTNVGKSGTALAIGSFATNRPQFLALGSGSGTTAITNVALVSESGVRKAPTSFDFSQTQKVTYTVDYNSVITSGLELTEFAMFTSGAFDAGSAWNREAFSAITFDGTNELQVQLTYEVF